MASLVESLRAISDDILPNMGDGETGSVCYRLNQIIASIETGAAVTPRPVPPAQASEGLRQLRAWHAARRDLEREDSLTQLHDRAVKALNVYFGPEEQL